MLTYDLRKKGKNYQARFYDPDRSSKRAERSMRTTNKREAERRARKMAEEYERGERDFWGSSKTRPRYLTLADAGKLFMKSRQGRAAKTLEAYETALKGLIGICPAGIMARDVTAEHARPYVLDTEVSSATRLHRYRHLRAFFNWCVAEKLMTNSPCDAIAEPREQQKVPEYLSEDEYDALISTIEQDYQQKVEAGQIRPDQVIWLRDVFLFAVRTGMRRGEVCNVRWRDVDFEHEFVRVRSDEEFRTKSGHERVIPLATDALEMLRRLRDERDDAKGFVFSGYGGKRLNGNYLSKQFRQYRELAGLDEKFSFHSLRHTFASHLVNKGTDLYVVKKLMGHSEIKMTQRYAHLKPDTMQAAIRHAFG
jgi:site-specific recombinase XerD